MIVHEWHRVVAPAFSRHAQAEKIVGDTLYVVVDSSVWMNELVVIKTGLLERINTLLDPGSPPITDIRFSQRSWAARTKKEPPACPPPEPDENQVRLARQLLEPVKDEELRAVLERILRRDLVLKAGRRPR